MRGAFFALAILFTPALAFASGKKINEDVHLRGWTDNGAAVVEIRDDVGTMSNVASWVGDAADQKDYWAVCVPQPIGTEQAGGEGACTVCKDAAACGLTTVMKRATPAKISPDHQIRVKDKKVCTGRGSSKSCQRVVTLGKLDTIKHDPPIVTNTLPASRVYFRPDSGAVMVAFEDLVPVVDGMPVQPRYTLYFVELTAASGPGPGDGREYGSGSGSGSGTGGTASTNPSRDGYRFALENVKKNANGTGGEADLVLQVTSGGNTTETQIDHLELTENGVYHMGDPVTIDRASKKVAIAGDDTPDLAKAITSHLPADTVVASGFVIDSERGYTKLVVGIVVQDTHGVSVVEQTWMDSGSEPDDSRTVKIP